MLLVDEENPREADVKTNSFNGNYPKILVDKSGTFSVLQSSVPTLISGETVAEPTDANFGVTYSLMTFEQADAAYLIHYVKPVSTVPKLPTTITSIHAVNAVTVTVI